MWEPLGRRLLTCQIYDRQGNLAQRGAPLLVSDPKEHTYYLQYKNQKTEFFKAVWNPWTWDDVAARNNAARKMDLHAAEPVGA